MVDGLNALGFGLRRGLNYFRGGYREIDPPAEEELQAQGILTSEPHETPEELGTAVDRS